MVNYLKLFGVMKLKFRRILKQPTRYNEDIPISPFPYLVERLDAYHNFLLYRITMVVISYISLSTNRIRR